MNFKEKVWNLTKKIPKGKVTTYKELARALNTRAYQAVGTALKKNPCAPKIPCHRVINSNGTVGGYQGKQRSKTKSSLLRKEGVIINKNKVNLKKYICKL